MSTRQIIFDLDGTLIDSAAGVMASLRHVLDVASITPCVPLEQHLIGPPLREILCKVAGTCEANLINDLAEAFKAHYDREGVLATPAYPGIDQLLESLGMTGTSLSIATNKRLLPTQKIIGHLGWACFSRVASLDSEAVATKAELLGHLAAECACRGDEIVYIGDKKEDGLAADSNNIPFIAVSWGYGNFKTEPLPAHWRVASSPGELLQLLVAQVKC